MSVPNPSIALVECLLLSGAVGAGCCRFAVRRRSVVGLVDAGLLFYATQYAAVGLAGVAGVLTWPVVAAVAMAIAAGLWFAGGARWQVPRIQPRPTQSTAVALFAVCFIGAFLWYSRFNPLPANDALTYHFPAAVQWLQTRRLSLLPTWFFNPSNTYSPLAGSMFVAWLMLPFRGDALARFVGAPALLCIGASLYALARHLNVQRRTACLLVAAAVLSRPFLNQMLLGKDDLFADFFFLAALLAVVPKRLAERGGAARAGLAVGLLLSTKYTALLAMPVLLLGISRQWTWRRVAVAGLVTSLIAGPWYVRNLWLSGNPIFPVALPGGFGRALFTSAASEHLRTTAGIFSTFTEAQGLPTVLILAGAVALALLLWQRPGDLRNDPILRVVVLGPILGIALFLAAAPFPEARFVQPEFALGFVAMAVALMKIARSAIRDMIALTVLVTAVATTINWRSFDVTETCTLQAASAASLSLAMLWVVNRWPRLRLSLAAAALLLLAGYTYVYWDAYVLDCRELQLVDTSPWQAAYPREAPLWAFVADHVPATATLAYTNTYLIYPLQGPDLSRRVVYAPTRAGVHTIADLPWLGTHLSGEALVIAANRALAAQPDRTVWMSNLRQSGAEYLLVMNGGVIDTPPEAAMAANDPVHFRPLFASIGGTIYAIHW